MLRAANDLFLFLFLSCFVFFLLQAELGKDAKRIQFTTSDLENLTGKYDTVLCIDVMIHYPTDKVLL